MLSRKESDNKRLVNMMQIHARPQSREDYIDSE